VTVLLVVRTVIGDLDPSINVSLVGDASGHRAEPLWPPPQRPQMDATVTPVINLRHSPIEGAGL